MDHPPFDLPDHLLAKATPELIAADARHFASIARSLETSISELEARLGVTRQTEGREGQQAMDRDLEVHRLTARLRTLRLLGLDACLGHFVGSENEVVYVGRLGLTDSAGQRLLVDWRSPAAEPFFGATHASPMGVVRRRRYRWAQGRIKDYWEEVFVEEGLVGHAALDDQSAFIASLGDNRSARMRDVLSTIQADQDAIIRAGSSGALVVDGGPGTGKTVVALHRAAYLLYADPRLGHHRGGVLFVGPHQPYLAYVEDVLPRLGQEGVQTCTLRDLVAVDAMTGADSVFATRLKSSARLVQAIETAVCFYEEPPTKPLEVSTDWADVIVAAEDWADSFAAADPGTAHNLARDQAWEELLTILVDKHDDEAPAHLLRRALVQNEDLVATFNRSWPLLDAAEVVGDLWSVPAYLRRCAPWLTADEVHALQRPDPQAWTVADLPFLDAAERRLGDPDDARRQRRAKAEASSAREQMAEVVNDLIASDDSEMLVMSMLRGEDLQTVLVDGGTPASHRDLLAGPFAHVIVDEAQELTDAEWQMLLARCPSGSFTIVGDRAQARRGFTESWEARLHRVGLDRVVIASLTVNYRTPEEIMTEAAPVIRSVMPDANVPISIRSTGVPVRRGPLSQLQAVLEEWEDTHPEGIACVIGAPDFVPTHRVRSLTPELSKGLEFDLVVLVDPKSYGEGLEGAVDQYVAMTRATQQLVVLECVQ